MSQNDKTHFKNLAAFAACKVSQRQFILTYKNEATVNILIQCAQKQHLLKRMCSFIRKKKFFSLFSRIRLNELETRNIKGKTQERKMFLEGEKPLKNEVKIVVVCNNA